MAVSLGLPTQPARNFFSKPPYPDKVVLEKNKNFFCEHAQLGGVAVVSLGLPTQPAREKKIFCELAQLVDYFSPPHYSDATILEIDKLCHAGVR